MPSPSSLQRNSTLTDSCHLLSHTCSCFNRSFFSGEWVDADQETGAATPVSIHEMAADGDLKALRTLLEADAAVVNELNDDGMSPLLLATLCSDYSTVRPKTVIHSVRVPSCISPSRPEVRQRILIYIFVYCPLTG